MNNAFKNINKLLVRTWSWLDVNDTNLKKEFPPLREYMKDPYQKAVPIGVNLLPIAKLENIYLKDFTNTKIKENLLDYIHLNRNNGYFIKIKKGQKVKDPIILSYNLDRENNILIDDTFILAEEGSSATIVLLYESDSNYEVYHGGLTRVIAEKNSNINLIKVQRLSNFSSNIDNIEGVVKGNLDVLLVELGSEESITNCHINLKEENSEGRIDSIYIGDEKRSLDINYIISHIAKNTISNIFSRGILTDESKKVFRGTIDFLRGSTGAKGKEEEYTLLLSPDIRNISAPLLLCGEDDVEGAHAASSGRIDEDMLFYLMTRGFDENYAKKIIVEASINPILERIENEDIRARISSYVKRRIEDV